MPEPRVLVVGTTPDYIDHLRQHRPGRALFVTDPAARAGAMEPTPPPDEEFLGDLTRPEPIFREVVDHCRRYGLTPAGVVAYDCESLELAAFLAQALELPFPSPDSVRASRSKFVSKHIWQRAGVPCPRAALIDGPAELRAFLAEIKGPVVLKPLTGSGSELVFICREQTDCERAMALAGPQLAGHRDLRLYPAGGEAGSDPRRVMCAEEFIHGLEYSADFRLEDGSVEIIRLAEKVPAPNQPAGTTLAYIVPGRLPPEIEPGQLTRLLRDAARALGLDRTVGMVDFIIQDRRIFLLEMTPRPGGDCLPPLIRLSGGLDILSGALEFAAGRAAPVPDQSTWTRLVGLRLLAARPGVITAIDATRIGRDPRVRDINLKHGPGHRVIAPPDDYDSRWLGHVIFEPAGPGTPAEQCQEIGALLAMTQDEVHG